MACRSVGLNIDFVTSAVRCNDYSAYHAVSVCGIIFVLELVLSSVGEFEFADSGMSVIIEFYEPATVFFDLHKISRSIFVTTFAMKPADLGEPAALIVEVANLVLLIIFSFKDPVGRIVRERDKSSGRRSNAR